MTHATLLARIAKGGDPAAWQEFCERYALLIRGFARRHHLQSADCDEVVQDTLVALAAAMPSFGYDPAKGKFRSYLKTVALHEIYRRLRQNQAQVDLEAPEAAIADATTDDRTEHLWEMEWRQYHLRQAMRIVAVEFNERDRAAFEDYAIGGAAISEVTAALQMSADQVYQAKSRILKRLSQIIQQQVQDEG